MSGAAQPICLHCADRDIYTFSQTKLGSTIDVQQLMCVCYVTWELSTVVERDQQNTSALREPPKWTKVTDHRPVCRSFCLSV